MKIGRRRLHNREPHSLYFSLNIVRVIKSRRSRGSGHLARCPLKILTGEPTGKRSLGRPRHRWANNTRMDINEISVSTRK